MSEHYIKKHFMGIKEYENIIEQRLDNETCTVESLLKDNARFLSLAEKHHVDYVLIDEQYAVPVDLP